MAGNPINTDLVAGRSPGDSGNPNPGSYNPSVQLRGQNQPAGFRSAPMISAFGEASGKLAQGIDSIQQAEQNEAQRQQEDTANMWLVQAKANSELSAQQAFDDARNNAKPGTPIEGDLRAAWAKHTDEQLAGDYGTGLKARYSEGLSQIQEGLLSKAKEYDRQENIRYGDENWKTGVEAKAKSYDALPDPLSIDRKFQADMGELNSANMSSTGDPETKAKRREYMLKVLPDAAVAKWTDLDPDSVASYAKGGFENAVNFVLRKEGGYVANDGGAGPTNFGINSRAHPGIDVANITQGQAKDIYKSDYWDAIGGDKLPPGTALIAFDAAVNMGVGTAKELLDKSGGDPQKLIDLRKEKYQAIAAANPDKAQYLSGWMQRLDDVAKAAGGMSSFRMGTYEQQRNWSEKAESKIRERRSEMSRTMTEGNQLIGTVEDRLNNSYMPPPNEMQSISQYVASSNNPILQQKWASTQDKAQAQQGYMRMNPAQLRNHIDTVLQPAVQDGGATKQEYDRLEIANKTLTAMDTQLQADPLGWYQRAGGSVAPLDFTKPEGMQQRRATAKMVSDAYSVPLEKAMFTPQEATQFVNTIKSTTPDKQVMAAMSFAQAFGTDTDNAAGIFHKDAPLFGYAASMIAADPSLVKTANDMLVGSKVLAEDKGAGVDKTKFDAEFSNWEGYFTNPIQEATIKQAAEAVYAARYYGKPFDADGLSTAMEEVVGGKRAQVGGNRVIAPPMTDPDAFEAWTQTVTQDRLKEIMGGTLPTYKSQVFDPKKHPMKLRSIEPGAYYIEGGDGLPLAGNGPGGIAVVHVTAADIFKDSQKGKK